MKLLAYGLFLVLALGSIKECHKHKDVDVDSQTVKLDETFDLEINKTVIIKGEKLGITFTKNKESRCPVDVNCMRAGEAKASIQLAKEDSTKELELEVKGNCQKPDGSCGESKIGMGYKVKLINVTPYPGTDAANNKETVKAKLQIMKN